MNRDLRPHRDDGLPPRPAYAMQTLRRHRRYALAAGAAIALVLVVAALAFVGSR